MGSWLSAQIVRGRHIGPSYDRIPSQKETLVHSQVERLVASQTRCRSSVLWRQRREAGYPPKLRDGAGRLTHTVFKPQMMSVVSLTIRGVSHYIRPIINGAEVERLTLRMYITLLTWVGAD